MEDFLSVRCGRPPVPSTTTFPVRPTSCPEIERLCPQNEEQSLWHPVRHLRFSSHSLITANMPNGASIMDDDLTARRRHRGIIYAYEFSTDKLVAESVLPICRSSYNEVAGYSYSIGLVVPYDNI